MVNVMGILLPNLFGIFAILMNFIEQLYKSFNHKIKILPILIMLTCILYFTLHAVVAISHGSLNYVEMKNGVYIVIAIILVVATSHKINFVHRTSSVEKLFTWIIVCLIFLSVYIFFQKGHILRFADYNPHKQGLMSIYVGCLLILIIALSEKYYTRYVATILLLLNASGTSIIGFLSYIIINKFEFRVKKIIVLSALVMIAVSMLVFGQMQRGRTIMDLMSIDRVVIQLGFIQYYTEQMKGFDVLFGCGINCTITPLIQYISLPSIANYLLAEDGGVITGKGLHNEHFRILVHYGVLGLLFTYYALWQLCKWTSGLFVSIFVMMLFNPIFLITPFYCLLLYAHLKK